MPAANYQALAALLATGPYAGLSDADAAAMANQPGASVQGPVPLAALLKWAAKKNVTPGLYTAADTAGPLQGVAQVAKLLLGGSAAAFDTADPDNQQLLGALTQGGVITSEAMNSLLSLGQTPGPSAAQQAFGYPVSDNDVAHARSLG